MSAGDWGEYNRFFVYKNNSIFSVLGALEKLSELFAEKLLTNAIEVLES